MKQSTCFCTLVLCGICGLMLGASQPGHSDASEIVFGRDIRPIFVAHCVACHGGVKQAADLSFVYPESVLPPDGWIVEPGTPDESELITRIITDDPELRMPPPEHGPALSAREIALLRDWITQGAKWQRHWSFEIPVAIRPPSVGDESWPRMELDRFVLKRLEEQQLKPSPDADPHRWLRRVYLDLTGLPPTPANLGQFLQELQELGESAYERTVDRLLDSKHFGERWASVWLDQVRYADSMGLGMDYRRTIWKYRDWVIQSINDDLPYDQFTIKQIAGDLLPNRGPDDLVATACHRLTQSNGEGGTDDEEFRIAAVLDRVNTTWQTWQGITFGCVQCHSHPYEPFEHEEYYQFAAYFNNTVDTDLDSDAPVYKAPIKREDNARANSLDRKITSLREAIWSKEYGVFSQESLWKPIVGLKAESNKSTQFAVDKLPTHDEFHTVGTVERDTDITLEAPLPADMQQLTAIRITVLPLEPEKAIADSEWGFVWSDIEAALVNSDNGESQEISIARVLADEPNPLQDPQESLNSESNQGFGAYTRIHYPRTAALVLSEPIQLPANARIRVKLKHRVYLLAAFSLVTKRGHMSVSDDPSSIEMVTSEQLQEQRSQLVELKKERSKIEAVSTPILRERPSRLARPTYVFNRGLFLDKGDRVEPKLPVSLASRGKATPDRLSLAQWIASNENPLTARVAVNRVWARLFGVGIVETEEDFGSSGEPPSHPGLLDHLAVRFQEEFNWSVKRLIREIVLSRTYRQSAVVTAASLQKDPRNRLLSRGPSHRLSAEIIRDQALAVSGQLNDEMYGPPVTPPIPAGIWKPFVGSDTWKSAKIGDPNRYRRSIYTYVKRSIPYPMHATFDQPSREFCTARRLRSNTPMQALELLNGESFSECAEKLAQRMQEESDLPDEQIQFGFLLTLLRVPSDSELAAVKALYHQLPAERALVAVATALLNLDEFITK